MTGAFRQQRGQVDGQRSRVTPLLWFITVLSVLQWTAPGVDPWLFARLSAGTPHEIGLAIAERQSPAVEARAPTSTIVFEKRSPGGRSLPSAEDAEVTVAACLPPNIVGRAAIGTVPARDGPGSLAGSTFTARGPPDLA